MIDFRFNYPHLDCQHAFLSESIALETAKPNLVGSHHFQMLRSHVATWLSTPEYQVSADQILATCGGNHALYVITQAADIARKIVVVDPLTYRGFVRLAAFMRIKLVPCRGDGHGFDPDELMAICKQYKVKAFYLIPTIHNPLAFQIPLERRLSIIQIARMFNVKLIEDDAYAFLVEHLPPRFMDLAPERTFSVTSLTKIVDPRFKIGFLHTPADDYQKSKSIVEVGSGEPSQIFERLSIEWIKNGLLNFFSQKKRLVAVRRQQLVRQVLADYEYVFQSSGFHIWVPFHNTTDVAGIVADIRNDGVDILSSLDCQTSSGCAIRGVRIAFGNVHDDEELLRGLEVIVRHIPHNP